MKFTKILFAFIVFVITSCSSKIDGSSVESYKESLENIKSDLNDEEKAKFTEAITKIAFSDIKSLSDLTDVDGIIEDGMEKLSGMTYEDVIKEGNRLQKIIDDKNKEQAKIEIAELYEKKDSSKKDSLELSKFKVEKSRFYKEKSGYYIINYDPIIDISVFNGTDKAISRAYFNGVIKSPNRTIPWLVKGFNYEISGGLEPEERDKWRLAPSSYSDWGKVDVPKDAILTVTVTRLDGADGKKIFSIDFDKEDRDRLSALLIDYPEFRE